MCNIIKERETSHKFSKNYNTTLSLLKFPGKLSTLNTTAASPLVIQVRDLKKWDKSLKVIAKSYGVFGIFF